MHSVFLVDEIFKAICEDIAESDGGLANLANLAQTCKSLEGISIDVLWAHGPVDLIDVLKTLPPDSWTATESTFVRSNSSRTLPTER